MRYLAPFVVHAALGFTSDDELIPHRDAYRRIIESLRDERIDLERAGRAATLNDDLDSILTSREVA
jgi:hypothetical protein